MLVWIAVAWAGSPAVEYYEAYADTSRRMLQRLVDIQYEAFVADDLGACERLRLEMRTTTLAYQAEIDHLGAFEGDKGVLEAAGVDVAATLRLLDKEAAEGCALVGQAVIHAGDLDRMRAIDASLNALVAESSVRKKAVDEAFCARHNIILRPAKETDTIRPPPFEAPWLSPPDPVLSAATITSFTLRYRNGMTEDQGAAVDLLNAFFDETAPQTADMDAARRRALAGLGDLRRATEARGGWPKDEGLLDATVALEDRLLALFAGDVAEMAKLNAAGFHKQEEVDRFNTLVRGLNSAAAEAMQTWQAEVAAFDERWHFAEYEAWSAKSKAWLAERRTQDAAPGETRTAGPAE